MEYTTEYMLQRSSGENRKRLLQLLQNENNNSVVADDLGFTDAVDVILDDPTESAKKYAEAKRQGRSGRVFNYGNDPELADIRLQVQDFLKHRKKYIEKDK